MLISDVVSMTWPYCAAPEEKEVREGEEMREEEGRAMTVLEKGDRCRVGPKATTVRPAILVVNRGGVADPVMGKLTQRERDLEQVGGTAKEGLGRLTRMRVRLDECPLMRTL